MPDLPQTRHSLLLRLAQSDDGAWAEFVAVYEGAILATCRARGLQEADARDVVQEVLAAVHAQIADWDPDRQHGSFRGWLLQIARRRSIDAMRARRRRPDESHDLDAVATREHADRTALEIEMRRATFTHAAGRVRREVKTTTWAAFEQTALDGQPADRVAQRLGLSLAAVYTAKCRVLLRIRERIEALSGDDPELRS